MSAPERAHTNTDERKGGGAVADQQWQTVRGVCRTPGAEGWPVYGVRVRCPDGAVWCWPDVDTDESRVRRLAARLQAAQPHPCHFEELVLDFIEETAGNL